jgi:hypothetical protein
MLSCLETLTLLRRAGYDAWRSFDGSIVAERGCRSLVLQPNELGYYATLCPTVATRPESA